MTPDEIHNIYVNIAGKAEGLVEAGLKADFPVMFADAILEYANLTYKKLQDEVEELKFDNEQLLKSLTTEGMNNETI